MKPIAIICVALLMAGCIPQSQRLFGYGPYQYCRAGDVCFQAGEKWEFYPFAAEDVYKNVEVQKACWAETNRANWDACTERF